MLVSALLCACNSTPPPQQPQPATATAAAAPAPEPEHEILASTSAQGAGTWNLDERIGQRFEPLDVKKLATDPRYGRTEQTAVRVGGGLGEGSHRAYGFLNALRGPHGEAVHYRRIGSCCPQPASSSSPEGGLLDVYEVTYDGAPGPVSLYVDWSREEELLIPAGFLGR